MAKLVDYRPQIGINRGRGLYQAAATLENSANKASRAQEYFANEALKDLKTEGAKRGMEEGLNAQMVSKEVPVTDEAGNPSTITVNLPPKTPDYLGITAKENFEKIAYQRYESNEKANIENIILKDYQLAAEKDLSPVVIENMLDEKRKIYIEQQSPKFGQLMDDHWNNTYKKHGLNYLETYGKRRKSDAKLQLTNEENKLNAKVYDSFTSGEYVSDQEIEEFYEFYETQGALSDVEAKIKIETMQSANTTAVRIVDVYGKYFGINREDIDGDQKVLDAVNKQNNRKLFVEMLTIDSVRPNSITLKFPGEQDLIVTRKQIDSLTKGIDGEIKPETFTTLLKYIQKSQSVHKELTAKQIQNAQIKTQYDRNKKEDNTLYRDVKNSEFATALDTNLVLKTDIVNDYNKINLDNPNNIPLDVDVAYDDPDFLKYVIETHKNLPESIARKYENAIVNYDTKFITPEIWDVISHGYESTKTGLFDFGNDFNFNRQSEDIAESVQVLLNNNTSMGITEAMQIIRGRKEEAKVSTSLTDVYNKQSVAFGQEYDSPIEFKNVFQAAFADAVRSAYGSSISIGGVFSAQAKNTFISEQLRKGSINDMLDGNNMKKAITAHLSKMGWEFKFGLSTYTSGINTVFANDGSQEDKTFVAFPIENIYPQLKSVEGYNLANKNIRDMIRDRGLNSQGQLLLSDSTDQKLMNTSGNGLLKVVPTNFNLLNLNDFKRQYREGNIEVEYYLQAWDTDGEKYEYLRDRNGELFVVGKNLTEENM